MATINVQRATPDGFVFSNLGVSGTTPNFFLKAGTFGLTVHDTGTANVTLNKLATDNVTWVAVLAVITANGYTPIQLSTGLYQVVTGSGTTLTDVSLVRIV